MNQPPPTTNPGHVTVQIPEAMLPEVQRMLESHAVDGNVPQFTSIPMTISLAALAAVVSLVMLVVVPKFEDIFKDFKAELPGMTKWFLSASRWFGGYGWVLLWLLPILAPIAITRLRRRPGYVRSPMPLAISISLTVLAIMAILITSYVALMLPMVDLLQTISGGPAKP
jgi:type IV pilus assembly protein PilC